MQEEFHPWNWFVPPGSKVIIIGTFPPTQRNWSYNFFYPNKNNLFWRMMARIAGEELKYISGEEAVKERRNILIKLGVGISDMGRKILRTDNSSLDEKLVLLEHMDIFRILEENPSIQKIIFTSSSGKSSAARWFQDFLALQGIAYKVPKGERPLKASLQIKGRTIETVVLYSTSPRAANRISFDQLVELYKNEIENT